MNQTPSSYFEVVTPGILSTFQDLGRFGQSHLGLTSGGQREFVPILCRAAVAIGVAGLFIEVHENPDMAPSDGPNMIKLSELKNLLSKLLEIDRVIKV